MVRESKGQSLWARVKQIAEDIKEPCHRRRRSSALGTVAQMAACCHHPRRGKRASLQWWTHEYLATRGSVLRGLAIRYRYPPRHRIAHSHLSVWSSSALQRQRQRQRQRQSDRPARAATTGCTQILAFTKRFAIVLSGSFRRTLALTQSRPSA